RHRPSWANTRAYEVPDRILVRPLDKRTKREQCSLPVLARRLPWSAPSSKKLLLSPRSPWFSGRSRSGCRFWPWARFAAAVGDRRRLGSESGGLRPPLAASLAGPGAL